jgi:hypothetical protein
MTNCDALSTRSMGRTERSALNSIPVLIQVPEWKRSATIRGTRRYADVGHSWQPVRARRGARRRLRREVRAAGSALFAVLPLMFALSSVWSERTSPVDARTVSVLSTQAASPPRHPGSRAVVAITTSARSEDGVPAVAIRSNEPPPSDTDAGVVLPGYLLPDDSFQESANAGS